MLETIFIFSIVILILLFFWAKKNGKKSIKDLKSLTMLFVIMTFSVLVIIGMNLLLKIDESNSSGSSGNVADGFTIDSFDVVLDVDENQKVRVNEKIGINFYEEGHHGIYRVIPYWLKYTNKNGETDSRKSSIDNISVSEYYFNEAVDGKLKLRIGNSSVTLPIGIHNYDINYDYNMGNDIYDGYDEFIFHAYGDYWGTNINNATIKIKMPKAFDGDLKFFADKYRKEDITSYIDYKIDDNIITAKVKDNYTLNSALTVDIVLPDGYFNTVKTNYGIVSFILCVLCLALAIGSYILWIHKGKDGAKVVTGGEFYPPNGYDAAEIGYIYKGESGKKLTVALIFSLAIKGAIKINKDKNNLIISKTTFDTIDEAINRKIKVVKVKEFEEFDKKSPVNKTIKSYFPGKTTEFVIESDFNNTLKDLKYLLDKGFINIESDTIDNYSSDALDNIEKNIKEEKEKIFSALSDNEKKVYDKIFTGRSRDVNLKENLTFYEVFETISKNVIDKFEKLIYDMSAYRYMVVCSFMSFVCALSFALAYCYVKDLNPAFDFMYTLSAISIFIIVIFTFIMGRKSTYGEELIASIKKFKWQIESIKDEELDSILENNKYYYYDMVPYTYIFGISKAWSKKFKNLPEPRYDMGDFDYHDTNYIYDSISSSIYQPSSSGSSGGCSSGCSSCGGGCSSCGGGGSW